MSEQTPPDDRPTGPVSGAHPDVDELSAYADGELDDGRGREVGAHLDACAECADDLRALRLVTAELAALPAPTMPADVAARLDEAIARERGAQPAQRADVLAAKRRPSPGWATGAAAAVAVGLLAVIGIGALSKVGGDDSDMKAESGSAPAAQPGSLAGPATTAIYASGTKYSKDALKGQVLAVMLRPADARADSETWLQSEDRAPAAPSATSAEPGLLRPYAGAVAEPLQGLATDPERLRACVEAVSPEVPPVAIDFGTFEGEPAVVVVLPSGADSFEVYFVGATCGVGGESETLYFEVIKRF